LHAFPERDASDDELLAALGLTPASVIVQVKQVHGGDVIEAAGSTGREADGLVARAAPGPGGPADPAGFARRAAVGMRVADCVPVLLADEATGDVAAVHAGWRGVTRGVVPAGVARLVGRGDPRRLVAAIGPCIGPCCFEVGADVAATIAAAVRRCGRIAQDGGGRIAQDGGGRIAQDGGGRIAQDGGGGIADEGARVIASTRGDKAYVDLRAAVRAQLVAAGLDDARVDDVGGCTKHEVARFHSFRRDGANSGRMLACIAAGRARMIP
jgi:YfiH family protein